MTEAATLSSTLDVSKAATLSSTLEVTGNMGINTTPSTEMALDINATNAIRLPKGTSLNVLSIMVRMLLTRVLFVIIQNKISLKVSVLEVLGVP